MKQTPNHDALTGLEVLADPVRRELYEHISSLHRPITRAEAAKIMGISRTLAAYHLDKLAEANLLTFAYARPEGVGGPGAGRPAKQYSRASEDFSVSLPPRSYDFLATLLANAASTDTSGVVREALMQTARAEGRQAVTPNGEIIEDLAARGYEPELTESGTIITRNCPFHRAAKEQPELVCGLNHALLQGYLEERGNNPDQAELAPCPGQCCVVIHGPLD
ncbi:helix-turn-helix domain-containing protein [Jonesiaceae bacterium BS-20]|uniref:Helix-turn-helix domain-containing protein n=1 Tax=Jonesiaceae bacterium BS-20 TaxID=3120821 RepID=A0AAU7DST1_9MICO